MHKITAPIAHPLPSADHLQPLERDMLRETLAELIHTIGRTRKDGRSLLAQGGSALASRTLYLASLSPRDDAALLLAAWADVDHEDPATRDHLRGRLEHAVDTWLDPTTDALAAQRMLLQD